MSYLHKALDVWTRAGHTQAEFVKRTGIEQSVCSRIFNGNRGLSEQQREAVFAAFREKELEQGLLFLKADVEDSIPPATRQFLHVSIDLPTSAGRPQEENRVEAAKNALIAELAANDPHALDLALALYDWKRKQ